MSLACHMIELCLFSYFTTIHVTCWNICIHGMLMTNDIIIECLARWKMWKSRNNSDICEASEFFQILLHEHYHSFPNLWVIYL